MATKSLPIQPLWSQHEQLLTLYGTLTSSTAHIPPQGLCSTNVPNWDMPCFLSLILAVLPLELNPGSSALGRFLPRNYIQFVFLYILSEL